MHENISVAQYELGNLSNLVYLVLDWTAKTAIWIDPQRELEPILKDLDRFGFRLLAIFLTHSHHDHTAGIAPLLDQFKDLKVWVHPGDRFRLKKIEAHRICEFSATPDRPQRIQFADITSHPPGLPPHSIDLSITIDVIHTPGHSAGGVCFLVRPPQETPYLISGDAVFIRDCGRTDLETGNDLELFESIQRLKSLAPHTLLLPGHHYAPEVASVLEAEFKNSPPFLAKTIEAFRNLP
jgi:hydroxyacylglutathione hydrolase